MFSARMARSKSIAGAILAGCVAALACADHPSGAAPAQRMPTATGRVTYRISGPMKGTMVLTWSESGRKYRQDTKMTGMPPMPAEGPNTPKAKPAAIQTWILSDGKDLYSLMPMSGKQVMRLKGMKGITGATGLGQLLGQAGGVAGGKVVGKAKLLGLPCDIVSTPGGKLWQWKGIPLRAEVQISLRMPRTTLVATKLEKSPKLSPSLFRVPAGYKVQDVDMSRQSIPGMPAR